MQPMQRCKKENDTQCIYQHREWFCPSALGFDHDPSALSKSGIVDFTSIHGNMMAYMPPDGPWEKSWRAVHITQTSAYQIAANLTGLDGLPIHAVRFAWGVFTTTRDETRCNKADEPLVGLSRPCPLVTPIVASGGLPANPFLARIIDGRCSCIPPQRCDGDGVR
mmetsp:Transcript_36455/g.72606  ORF Transcript_36455/g.72606 Transcript_36455/m.72606 type:complete len:165 (-) Transcript_36455:226-720(-)